MKKLILLSFLTLTLSPEIFGFHSNPTKYIKKPFSYTVILQNVDYTNGFELENGIKMRSRFKCPIYYVDSLGFIEEICPDNGTSDTF